MLGLVDFSFGNDLFLLLDSYLLSVLDSFDEAFSFDCCLEVSKLDALDTICFHGVFHETLHFGSLFDTGGGGWVATLLIINELSENLDS